MDGSRRLTTRNRKHLRRIPNPVDIDILKKRAEKAVVEDEEDEEEHNTHPEVPIPSLLSPVQTSAPVPIPEPLPETVQIPNVPGPYPPTSSPTSPVPIPSAGPAPAPESPIQQMPLRWSTRERHAPPRLEVGTGKKKYSDVVQVVKMVKDVRRNLWGREGERSSNPIRVLHKSNPSCFKSEHMGQMYQVTPDTSQSCQLYKPCLYNK